MDGIMIVKKEAGMTSHDVVFQLRKILHTKKIGHSGTLDPQATGVMIVLIGKATKILPFLEDVDKEYIAEMKLGQRRFSDDIWGEVVEEKDIIPISDLESVLLSFKGKIQQLPPMVSSVKVNGKKLYEYARKGEVVDRPLREVEIYDITVLNAEKMRFRVHCSSGTYIRSLCVDIAEKTGNLGYMSFLERSKVGRFSLEDAFTLAEIKAGKSKLFSISEMLSHLPFVEWNNTDDIYHGKKIFLSHESDRIVITHQRVALAIYEREQDDCYRSARGLW